MTVSLPFDNQTLLFLNNQIGNIVDLTPILGLSPKFETKVFIIGRNSLLTNTFLRIQNGNQTFIDPTINCVIVVKPDVSWDLQYEDAGTIYGYYDVNAF